jgi:hypothetical protein
MIEWELMPCFWLWEQLKHWYFADSGGASLQCRRAAINQLEEDTDLSENERIQAIRLFSCQTAVSDTYLAIRKKAPHTRYIQSEILEN